MTDHGAPGPAIAYPLEPIRDRYVSPFGGVSYDLGPYEIGVNAEALANNTTLSADACVMVGASPDSGRPYLGAGRAGVAGCEYRVVPLDDHHRDALRHSPRGEVVFSSFDGDANRASPVPWLRLGDPVTLNAILGRFPVELRRVGEAI